jgi:hypothetical protein
MQPILLPHDRARFPILDPGKVSWLAALLLLFAICLVAWAGIGLLVAKLFD